MLLRTLSAFLIALVFSACATIPSPSALIGHWSPQSAQLNGAPLPIAAFDGAVLDLTADTYQFGIDRGTYAAAVVGSGTPAKMDVEGKSGPNAGKHIPAIWTTEGDTLTIAYQLAGGDRPTEFKSPAGARVLLVTYKRAS
jgi:uncharacterized protein (TIGR03067 family)